MPMDRHFSCLLAAAALLVLVSPGLASATQPAPVLQLSGNDFPELVVLSLEPDATLAPNPTSRKPATREGPLS